MIEVKNLSKKYGNFEAVKDVSFSVGRVEVLGFLGPNGAGKTTIMKILTGCHYPSGGEARINGISVEDDPVEIKKRIGYLPENNPLYGDLSPEEYLYFAASGRLISGKERQKAVDFALAACGIESRRNQRIDSLSKGFRQRVGLAQAIIHDPDILILDEPTSGLDPNQIIEIRSLIRELGKRKTVILSTHILQEVEAVCSRVLILNEGIIAAQGTPEEIAHGMMRAGGRDTWELFLKGALVSELPDRLSCLRLAGPACIKKSEVSVEALDDGVVRLNFTVQNDASGEGNRGSHSQDGESIFDWAVEEGYKIIGMKCKKLSLEDIFVKLTGELPKDEDSSSGGE